MSQCQIWTPDRNALTSCASHVRLVGELLIVLVGITSPRNDAEREAMQRLRDVLYGAVV